MRSTPARRAKLRHKPRFLLGLEPLERRMVLSGVTCSLSEGLLTIRGTDGADVIALQADSLRETVNVRVGGQVVQQFCVHDVRRIEVVGLQGHDQFHVDEGLGLPLAFVAPEGEGPALVGRPTNGAPGVVQDAVGAAVALLADLGRSSQTSLTSSHAHDHSEHVRNEPAAASSAIRQSAVASSAAAALAQATTSAGHQHASPTDATVAAQMIMSDGAPETSPVSTGNDYESKTVAEHAQHAALDPHGKASTEFVKKWCTTTPWAKQLLAGVDAKPVCKCDAKPSGVAAASVSTIEGAGQALQAAVVDAILGSSSFDCQPCQADLFWMMARDMQITGACPMTAQSALFAVTDPLSVEDTPHAAQPQHATGSVWSERLGYVGWTLMGASAALFPLLRDRRRKQDCELIGSGEHPLAGGFPLERLSYT